MTASSLVTIGLDAPTCEAARLMHARAQHQKAAGDEGRGTGRDYHQQGLAFMRRMMLLEKRIR